MTGLRVGQVAARAGVNLQTVHYYERVDLLPRPARTSGNYRAHPEETVRRVRFVRRAQEIRFTLKEIAELLELRGADGGECDEVRVRAEAKLHAIDIEEITW